VLLNVNRATDGTVTTTEPLAGSTASSASRTAAGDTGANANANANAKPLWVARRIRAIAHRTVSCFARGYRARSVSENAAEYAG
jgi:hypothetical protein